MACSKVQTVAEQMDQLRYARDDVALHYVIKLEALHLSGADLSAANLSGADLSAANLAASDLEGANLAGAYVLGASLAGAYMMGANLTGAALEGADLTGANLLGTNLAGTNQYRANLAKAMLGQADLSKAILGRANLAGARLEGANLAGADLDKANLAGADLSRVTFDLTTNLADVCVTDNPGRFATLIHGLRRRPTSGSMRVADLHWNGVDLTVVDWSGLHRLGDERSKRWWHSREEAEVATCANIQLSKQLDNAGLKDDSDRFAYRAQVCQRGVHLRRFRLGRWLFSWLLFILAGYGYRPLRTLFWYLAVIGAFAFAYFQATHGLLTFGLLPSQIQPLPWYEALVLSVSSFHGRGFFQPVQSLGDPVAILAAIEAVFGLFIEVSFIATFTQQYFGK